MKAPEVAVVVASHDRPLRLRWLLNALEEQTLAPDRFEVRVAHDSGTETEALLRGHPLARAGVLHGLSHPSPSGPAEKRNAAWRQTRAPLIAFTDDDCRPPADWLEHLLAAAHTHPGCIVQGATHPDPEELGILHAAPHARTQEIEPPDPWAQTCNILYPRGLLEALGGFDERLPEAAGEDTDLGVRASERGASLVAASDAVTYHAVEDVWLPARIRSAWRWQHLAYTIKRHPGLRRHLVARIWWKPEHAAATLAACALPLAGRRSAWWLLTLPWLRYAMAHRGYGARGLLRSLTELPGRAAIDAVEVLAMARGSVRYRTIVL
ncbi:MAG: glycosyltransferase family 2 protein [Actinomycetota bacterium]|nr:glycosyltransferase family 2 protein [Actinomycetota bacterium]